jgi:hypothetical protein
VGQLMGQLGPDRARHRVGADRFLGLRRPDLFLGWSVQRTSSRCNPPAASRPGNACYWKSGRQCVVPDRRINNV